MGRDCGSEERLSVASLSLNSLRRYWIRFGNTFLILRRERLLVILLSMAFSLSVPSGVVSISILVSIVKPCLLAASASPRRTSDCPPA